MGAPPDAPETRLEGTQRAVVDRQAVLTTVRRALKATNHTVPDDLPLDTELKDELGLDSLDIVEFVSRVEEAFRVTVPDEDWMALSNLGLIVDYIVPRLQRGLASRG